MKGNVKILTSQEKNGSAEEDREKTEQKNNETQEDEAKRKKKEVDETIRTIEIAGVKSYMQAQSKGAKIFWLTLLLASSCIFIWQLYKTISNYIDSPIVSTYTITTVPEMIFPIIYLCPTTLAQSDYLNRTPSAERDALELKEDMGVVWDYVKFLSGGNLTEPFPLTNAVKIFSYSFTRPRTLDLTPPRGPDHTRPRFHRPSEGPPPLLLQQ